MNSSFFLAATYPHDIGMQDVSDVSRMKAIAGHLLGVMLTRERRQPEELGDRHQAIVLVTLSRAAEDQGEVALACNLMEEVV